MPDRKTTKPSIKARQRETRDDRRHTERKNKINKYRIKELTEEERTNYS